MFPLLGIILLTAIYGMCAAAVHLLSPTCSDEPCQDEGVDNAVSMWAGNFFVASFALLFGLHLSCFKASARKSGVLAQIFMSGSFALMGIARWKYPNNGSTDRSGLKEYWMVWAVSSFFFALSACCHTSFAIESSIGISKLHRPCCAGLLVRVWLAGVLLSSGVNIAGCIWCYVTPSLHADDAQDNLADNLLFEEKHMCIQMITVSKYLMWLGYALLWIPVGLLLKCATRRRPGEFLGLPAPVAAGMAVFFQWVGSFIFLSVAFVAWIRGEEAAIANEEEEAETYFELWERIYGAEIFHYAVVMTLCCAHTLSWTLTAPESIQKAKTSTDKSELVTKSMLATAIDEAEKGIATISDAEKGTSLGSNSTAESASIAGSVDPAEFHEPPPLDAKPASSALRHPSEDASKSVNFK